MGGSGVTQRQDAADPDGKAPVGQHLKGVPDAVEVAVRGRSGAEGNPQVDGGGVGNGDDPAAGGLWAGLKPWTGFGCRHFGGLAPSRGTSGTAQNG